MATSDVAVGTVMYMITDSLTCRPQEKPRRSGARLSTVATLWQRPDDLPVLLLCESLEGRGPDVAGGTEGQHEFCHGFIIRRLYGRNPVVLAERHVEAPELDRASLGQSLRRSQAFRGGFDVLDSLFRPVGENEVR